MTKGCLLLAILAVSAGCAPRTSGTPKQLVFLTRGGCVNTTTMRANLDAALSSMALPPEYQVTELETLTKGDPRTGYPTPTILFRDRDLFEMPVPKPPFPEPT